MRAVMIRAFGAPPELTQTPDPQCPPDGVVVSVQATGLCRSDWHGWMGHDDEIELPHVPGHELAGTVVESGPQVTWWKVGDRVTTPFVLACGRCRACARGDGQVCEDQLQPGFTQWGSFADLVALPRADVNLVRVPDEVHTEVAASLGCRFATAYRAVAHVARVQPGETVVVHGCGGVGLSAVMVAIALGAQVLAIDPNPTSLALAEQLGATPMPHGDTTGEIADLTNGGADVSFDAFGSRTTSPRQSPPYGRAADTYKSDCSATATPPRRSTWAGCSGRNSNCSAATGCRPRTTPRCSHESQTAASTRAASCATGSGLPKPDHASQRSDNPAPEQVE
jgi:alcohol dehydrogenase